MACRGWCLRHAILSIPLGRPVVRVRQLLQSRQVLHDVECVHAHANDLLHQVHNVARIASIDIKAVLT